MAPPRSSILKIGIDILATALDSVTGLITAQLGDVVEEQAESQAAKWVQHVGFASRPAIPTPQNAAAQAYCITQSDYDICIASSDQRTSAMYGQLKDGETSLFASTGQARCMAKADGSISLMTTSDNTKDGAMVAIRVLPTAIQFIAPWGKLVFDATGLHVLTLAGARLDLGAMIGLPAPLSSLSSYATISAGIVNCDGSSVNLGPSTGVFSPAAIGAPGTTGGTPVGPTVPTSSSVTITV